MIEETVIIKQLLSIDHQTYARKAGFIDKQNIIRFFGKGKHILPYEADYKYLGIGTLTGAKNFSIKNARYDLQPIDLSVPTVYSSNEYLNRQAIEISCESGTLIVINSRDKK